MALSDEGENKEEIRRQMIEYDTWKKIYPEKAVKEFIKDLLDFLEYDEESMNDYIKERAGKGLID